MSDYRRTQHADEASNALGSKETSEGMYPRNLWKDPRLWCIIALALALGLAASLPYLHETTPRFHRDDLCYHDLAKALLETGCFESTYRAPGYPVFVALVYAVFGPHPFAVYAVQSVLFAISLAFVAVIFEHITRSRTIALAGIAASACYPFFYIKMLPSLLTEALALFEISLFLFVLQRAIARPAWWISCSLGLAFAAATLTKAVLLPFVAVTTLCLMFLVRGRRTGIRQGLLFLMIVVLCVAPWIYRNWKVTGVIVPISTGGGTAFWMGNYPGNYDGRLYAPDRMKPWPHLTRELEHQTQGMTEVQRDAYLQQVALDYMRKDPGTAGKVFLRKFSNLWLGSLGTDLGCYRQGTKPLLALGNFAVTRTSLLHVPIVLLALVTLSFLTSTQRRRALPVVLLLMVFTAGYVAVVVEEGVRYAMPVFPYLLGFAVIPVVRIAGALLRRANPKWSIQ